MTFLNSKGLVVAVLGEAAASGLWYFAQRLIEEASPLVVDRDVKLVSLAEYDPLISWWELRRPAGLRMEHHYRIHNLSARDFTFSVIGIGCTSQNSTMLEVPERVWTESESLFSNDVFIQRGHQKLLRLNTTYHFIVKLCLTILN